MNTEGNTTRLEFRIPSRGLIGYRSEFLTDTKGNGVMNHIFSGYEEWAGDIPERQRGSIIAHEQGESTAYGLFNAQDRGTLFIVPGTQVYAGMVVGFSPKGEDITVNVCKKKHIMNIRAAGSDEALRLHSPRIMSLEESLEYLSDDELLEVTPQSLRIRKRVLDHAERMRMISKNKQ